MTKPTSREDWALSALAVLFAAATLCYGVLFMGAVRWEPRAWTGLKFDEKSLEIVAVDPDGPAARARVKPFDRITAIDGRPMATALAVHDAFRAKRPGERLRLTLRLAGLNDIVTLELDTARRPTPAGRRPSEIVRSELARSYPILLLAVGLPLVLLGYRERNAWLLGLVLAGGIAAAPLLPFEQGVPPLLRGFAFFYKVLIGGSAPALLYYLCAVFPGPSPLDERWPELKTMGVNALVGLSVPTALSVLVAPGLAERPLARLVSWLGALAWAVALVLAGTSLAWTSMGTRDEDARRRVRIVAVGALAAAAGLLGIALPKLPFLPWLAAVAAVSLLPLSLTYAVTAAEARDVPLLLRLGARYLLVERGLVGVLVLSGAVLALTLADLVRGAGAGMGLALFLGAGLGALLVGALLRWRGPLSRRIDRALFRSASESREVLERLVTAITQVANAEELTQVLEHDLEHALAPRSLAIYLADGTDRLRIARGCVSKELREIPLDAPLLPRGDRVAVLGPDCLVPIAGCDGVLKGLFVLGPRRTEEPYSAEDKRLLLAVASAAAGALEPAPPEEPTDRDLSTTAAEL